MAGWRLYGLDNRPETPMDATTYLRVQLSFDAAVPMHLDAARFLLAVTRARVALTGDVGAADPVLREVEQAACRARVLVEASSLASLAADSRGFLRRMAVVAESER
ncbi:hypothetical protein EMIHUDRAFT_113093 [Emiliania huxleyi CCMP1516]|uniref:Uncharacterized protein n=2 Tax=Emiliania huxleyi TaxID=2903 RepID=A0A0D3K503_EMIH1|nr:hypothetical protein EMIHUDRAFT_113093 [Emiliania huxleyi CCMP1516]EOD30838.1 hypothetical protein EMIHUDRAFT_113093 [Emiliania huxleyi CCMP1516]|eukprot:XP_005783267.1 hypothetical protein EMIHUDRAFT_113093 [Emiliania huxleyi CCMP1516]